MEDSIRLNFVPLVEQNGCVTIYRTKVSDNSKPKRDGDFRAKLPSTKNNDDWDNFDVSTVKQSGYKQYEYEYSGNYVLSIHLIYLEFLQVLKTNAGNQEFYIPNRAVTFKEVHFVIEKFEEGNAEIIVKPYFLKKKREFGFLIDHKFALNDDQTFNKQVQIRSFSLDTSGKQNIYFYRNKKSVIKTFINNVLSPLLSDTRLDFNRKFSSLPTDRLAVKTYLVGNDNTSRSQFLGIKDSGPYRRLDDKVRFLFAFTERTKPLATEVYLGLVGKLFPSHFTGTKKMFNLPIHKGIVDHEQVNTFDAGTIRAIENRIQQLKKSNPEITVMLVAVLPKGFKGVDAAFNAYGNIKLMALNQNICCQVVTEDSFFKKNQLKWSISNIGLQIFCKLGGVPWLVKAANTNCLIFGLGSAHERNNDNITKYRAYTVCLDSSGEFKFIKPLSSSSDEETYLKGLETNLNDVLSGELDKRYESLVLHLPYKISKKEVEVVKAVTSKFREYHKLEVIVIRVNTKHKFYGFSSHNTCVPHESTYMQLSKGEFLMWTEGLQYGNEVLHKRTSEPLYVEFMDSELEWASKKECLQDLLNLSGANWRGFNSKAQPISILYSRLIAKFMKEFSHLENVGDTSIVSAESVAPWFL